jgi:hypothetical protein
MHARGLKRQPGVRISGEQPERLSWVGVIPFVGVVSFAQWGHVPLRGPGSGHNLHLRPAEDVWQVQQLLDDDGVGRLPQRLLC